MNDQYIFAEYFLVAILRALQAGTASPQQVKMLCQWLHKECEKQLRVSLNIHEKSTLSNKTILYLDASDYAISEFTIKVPEGKLDEANEVYKKGPQKGEKTGKKEPMLSSPDLDLNPESDDYKKALSRLVGYIKTTLRYDMFAYFRKNRVNSSDLLISTEDTEVFENPDPNSPDFNPVDWSLTLDIYEEAYDDLILVWLSKVRPEIEARIAKKAKGNDKYVLRELCDCFQTNLVQKTYETADYDWLGHAYGFSKRHIIDQEVKLFLWIAKAFSQESVSNPLAWLN